MYWIARAAALLTYAAGLLIQAPPQARIATFNGASLYIQGDPSKPVVMQGYNEARQIKQFPWDQFRDKLSHLDDPNRRFQADALVTEMMEDDEAAAMLLNMYYAQKRGYSYILYSYSNVGGWKIDGACSHKGSWIPSHWCKVQAMEHAMGLLGESNLFLWMDADVMVRSMNTDLRDYIGSASRCLGEEKPTSNVSVFAWVNSHWHSCPFTGRQANSGVVVLQRGSGIQGTSDMYSFLRQWWLKRDWTPAGGNGSCDQVSFNEALEVFPWKSRVVFAEDNFQDMPSNYFAHRCGACDWMPALSVLVNKTTHENNISLDMLRDVLLRVEDYVIDVP
mmetsp:Transcript_78085/g.211196  ORF Transcript_78085/g.211196 Transcript_78085/m.211196 type:complete len:334 (-) Transcript_78085:76-1077(-)